jgi:hypothetical protein
MLASIQHRVDGFEPTPADKDLDQLREYAQVSRIIVRESEIQVGLSELPFIVSCQWHDPILSAKTVLTNARTG